jgi:hypothetical protein
VFIADEPMVPERPERDAAIVAEDEDPSADTSLPRIRPEAEGVAEVTEVPELPVFAERSIERATPVDPPPVVIADEPEEPRFVLDDLLDERPLPPEDEPRGAAIADEPDDPAVVEAEGIVDVVIEMEPAESRPPERTEATDPQPEPEPEPVVVTEEPGPVDIPVDIPIVDRLEPDVFYLQIGAWTQVDSVGMVVRDLENDYPLAVTLVETPERTLYRVFIGPLGPDERGIALFNVRSRGFRDAFVRRGGES